MHDISEHYTEKEWEGDNCEYGWIDLFVCGCSISVNNLLEDPHEFTALISSWYMLSL